MIILVSGRRRKWIRDDRALSFLCGFVPAAVAVLLVRIWGDATLEGWFLLDVGCLIAVAIPLVVEYWIRRRTDYLFDLHQGWAVAGIVLSLVVLPFVRY
jgi:hypothetical protein